MNKAERFRLLMEDTGYERDDGRGCNVSAVAGSTLFLIVVLLVLTLS